MRCPHAEPVGPAWDETGPLGSALVLCLAAAGGMLKGTHTLGCRRRRMGAGVPPGLQNRCAGSPPVGGFDSRPPPLCFAKRRRTRLTRAISPPTPPALLG